MRFSREAVAKVITTKVTYPSSIHQRNSWAHLEICPLMLKLIMEKHGIMPEFLDIIQSFQDRKLNTEEAFGASSWKRCLPDSKGSLPLFNADMEQVTRSTH